MCPLVHVYLGEEFLGTDTRVDIGRGLDHFPEEREPLGVERVNHERFPGLAQTHLLLSQVHKPVLVAERQDVKPVPTVGPIMVEIVMVLCT